jgi:EmrB/QacA subfamily drug resistance transporter
MPREPVKTPTTREIIPLAAAVMTGVLSTSFSAIFANIALPHIMADFAVGQSTAHWIITGFVTVATLTMLMAGWCTDTLGLRRLFLGNVLVFLVASLVGGFASQLGVLIAARTVQGAVMGFVSVTALIALFSAFPIEKRGRAGALFGLGMALAPTIGPTVSGFIVEWWGWRSIFFVPMPLALISFLLGYRILPSTTDSNRAPKRQFDWGGFFLTTTFLALLFGGASYLQQNGWPIARLTAYAAGLAILLVSLVAYESRRHDPLLALPLFKYRVFTASALVSFLYGMGLWGSAYLVSLYLQEGVGLGPLATGLVMLPSGVVLCLLLPLGGRLIDRYPAYRVVTAGLIFSAAAFLSLGVTPKSTSLMIFALLITLSRGLGLGIMIPGLDATATRGLPAAMMNDGVAMMNFLRQLGGAMSPTLLMLIYEWRLQANTAAAAITPGQTTTAAMLSYQQTALLLGAIFLAGILPAVKMRLTKP